MIFAGTGLFQRVQKSKPRPFFGDFDSGRFGMM